MNPGTLYISCLFLMMSALRPMAAESVRSSQKWVLLDGTAKEGEFVDLTENSLIIRSHGSDSSINRAWLAPASLELAQALESGMNEKLINTILLMEFVKITTSLFTADTFDMGAPESSPLLQEFEPCHRVKITKPFLLKQTEVTWNEWNSVRNLATDYGYTDIAPGRNGYQGDESGDHPVTEVSWWDAVKWCNLKSQIEGKRAVYYTSPSFSLKSLLLTGTGVKATDKEKAGPVLFMDPKANGYRLPTEAEWEIAWHVGGRAYGFAEPDGWHNQSSNGNTHPVRSMPSATSKKLHDMLGNVAEWCWDWKAPITKNSFSTDPTGPPTGTHRIFRGGSWADHPFCCRPTYRGDYSPVAPRSPFIGFRPARNSTPETEKSGD